MNTSSNKRKTPAVNSSILESLRELSGNIKKSVASDVAGGIGRDALQSIFGNPSVGQEQTKARNEYRFPRETDRPQPAIRPEFVRPSLPTEDERELKTKIEAVRNELKALSTSISSLNSEIRKAVQESPVDPGLYHLNYFERLLAVLKLMRQQIEESRTWLTMWSTRKKQRMYWRMYKKHGTTFGLSHERTMATQAG